MPENSIQLTAYSLYPIQKSELQSWVLLWHTVLFLGGPESPAAVLQDFGNDATGGTAFGGTITGGPLLVLCLEDIDSMELND